MIRAVVFDLDGTLVDSFEDIARAANHALESLGAPRQPVERIKTQVGRGLRNLIKGLAPEENEETIDRAVERVKAYYEEHPTDRSELYPGALETLDRLGEMGVSRAVLSNKLDSLVAKIARNLGFETRMEAIWGHREGWPLKPDPSSLVAILKGCGVQPSECLIVGDADPDRELALESGAHFCAVTYGMTPRGEWANRGVNFVVDSLSEIPGILEQIGRKTVSSPQAG